MVRSSLLSVAHRVRVGALLVLLAIVVLPQRAAAGGTEFPADGSRNLGRGGAGMARADDPYVMVRNPARLADLWDDQAMIGAHFLMADSCFQPTGAYSIGTSGMPTALNVGGEMLVLNAGEGATDLNGQLLNDYADEPYPEVCYEGPMPFLPHVALTMKPRHDLGVGLGFFPPDNAALNQWGNRDGTVDTANGLRPNPLRYYRSHLNTSYFSVLGSVGYRISDFIRIGFGFQWQLAVFQARTWTTANTGLNPVNDVRTDVFGRDLFIPGFIGSVHLKPFDALDVAIGFKWSDLVQSKAKLDLTSSAFGTGEGFNFIDGNGIAKTGTTGLPFTTHNQTGEVRSGPVWVPQLSFGLRYADRLKPLVHDDEWAKAKANSKTTEDSMANERWDIELDVIYYFTSMFDYTQFTNSSATVGLYTVDPGGEVRGFTTSVGDCTEMVNDENGMPRCVERRVRTEILGKDQITARLGGDYNVLPGILALRAGASYEADGQDPKSLNPTQYMYGRLGMHGGFTWRIAEKTDFSFAFAHFIQKEMRLQVHGRLADYGRLYRTATQNGIDPAATYHLQTGSGFGVGSPADEMAMAAVKGPFDGVGMVEVPNAGQVEPGPYFINGGSFFYNLSVLSVELTQRF